MTTYKEIFGKPVKFLGTDPDNSEAEGQIWYNSTSGSFKSVVQGEAWSSGSPLITERNNLAGFGTQTSAVAAGGEVPGGVTTATEEYNGSGWSSGGALNTSRRELAGSGTLTAGLAFGGGLPSPASGATEKYDGSAWTSSGSMSTARGLLCGFGTQTSSVAAGGTPPITNATEEFNGSTWTAGGNLNTSRFGLGGAGTLTAGLAFSGNGNPFPTLTSATEEYNGTAWTSVNPVNTTRALGGSAGTQTAALFFGGSLPGSTGATEKYDGTSWTTSPATLGTPRSQLAGAGSQTAALGFGNIPGGQTEEYNRSTSVITPGAWASGGNMNTGRYLLAGTDAPGSTANALLGFGGYGPSPGTPSAETESYDGSSWTTETNLPAAASRNFGTGTLTAALQAGGLSPPSVNLSASNEWNGSSWTAGNPINEARGQSGAFGIQTASVIVGGARFFASPPPADVRSTVEEYDGTSWATGTATPVATRNRGGAGILTAGIAWAGTNSPDGSWPGSATNETLLYDGTTWTTGGNFNNPSPTSFTGGGTQTAAWSARHPNASHEQYNGTTWASAPSTSSTAGAGASGSGQTSAVVFAGFIPGPGPTTATEEFTGETSALNLKTLTTS